MFPEKTIHGKSNQRNKKKKLTETISLHNLPIWKHRNELAKITLRAKLVRQIVTPHRLTTNDNKDEMREYDGGNVGEEKETKHFLLQLFGPRQKRKKFQEKWNCL